MSTQADELLSILLVSLRNAAATFGEGSPPYESIRKSIEEHVQAMQASGHSTNITHARQSPQSAGAQQAAGDSMTLAFENLAIQPKQDFR
ncbi:hypothetical protein WHR41_08146 [Cladosporium halotolerans]|uniref:Uncharacterized protein n=1 Tax=Cladosporium halotolerans TaxID=1052096 RepID=A0AB34KKK5_9PEZI